MAPEKGASTVIQNNPVPHTGAMAGLLDLIPNRGGQILVPRECMGVVAQEESLMICVSSSDSDVNKTTLCQPYPSPWAEGATASTISVVWGAPQAPQAQMVATKVTKTTIQDIGLSVAPTIYRENQGFVHDSARSQREGAKVDEHNRTAAGCAPTPYNSTVSKCTDTDRRRRPTPRQAIRLTDFNELRSSSDMHQHVNTEQRDVMESYSKRNRARDCTDSYVVPHSSEASHTHLGCHASFRREEGTVYNVCDWVQAVKAEVRGPASLRAEENWPPLLACSRRGANQKHEAVHLGDMEHQSDPFSVIPQGKPAVPLDEQSWPSLEKSSKPSILHDDFCSDNKRRTLRRPLIKSNMYHRAETAHSMMQSQRLQAEQFPPRGGRFHGTENMHIPPLLLMLNKDFIVTSPLKENLLLTLVLMGNRTEVETSPRFHRSSTEGEIKRQILVGQFRAFSSFLNFMLGRDATRVRTESNAGGTSTISESLSVEYFVRRFQAKDIVTEMEVEYQSFNWKKVDYICTLYGQRVGVSVTRAMSFPDPNDFSAQMAYRLLYKKLFGLVVARHGVSKRHSFSRCILHVWCETQQAATIMKKEYDGVSRELDIADDVVMVLTIADGCHARPIFYEYLLKNG